MKNEDVTQLAVELLPGNIAPRYTIDDCELSINKAVITEKGMQSGLPLVDLQMKDADGNINYTALSGRIVNAISAAIKGVNLRNHGTEEP